MSFMMMWEGKKRFSIKHEIKNKQLLIVKMLVE